MTVPRQRDSKVCCCPGTLTSSHRRTGICTVSYKHKNGSKITFSNFRRRVILIRSAHERHFWEIREMTPDENARLSILCKRINDEQNPKVFTRLLEQLNEFLGGTPKPAEGKRPVQIHRDLMPPEPIFRCAYCRLGNEFRPMIIRAEGWLQCESCGHNAMPLDPEFRCTCANCGHTEPTLP
jgi:hypothetical protein